MSHAFVTIIAAVPTEDIAALRTTIEALGNPAVARVANALDVLNVIHFASINVFEASAGDRGHLVFEFSGDEETSMKTSASSRWKSPATTGPGRETEIGPKSQWSRRSASRTMPLAPRPGRTR